MEDFISCLNDCKLLDLGFTGYPFTWKRVWTGEVMIQERLDRFMGNEEWTQMFKSYVMRHEAALIFDHWPIRIMLLNSFKSRQGYFRIEKNWLEDERFETVLKEAWVGDGDRLKSQLRTCGDIFADWGKRVYGNIRQQVNKASRRLNQLMERGGIMHEIVCAGKELNDWLDKEETYWAQRSRVQWLKDGNRNTSFFHEKASQRRQKNKIDSITDATGVTVEVQENIKKVVVEYFEQLFSTERPVVQNSETEIPCRVTEEMNHMLTAPFVAEEVQAALKSMHPHKAPGPDGYTAYFFQKYWHIVGKDVSKVVLQVLNKGEGVEKWNQTTIVLIPKSKNPTTMKDYRPISLCNIVYKLVSKVMANRLKLILPIIISRNQSAFVPGRQITDNVLVAFECFHSIKNKRSGRRGNMALKLHVSKAYD